MFGNKKLLRRIMSIEECLSIKYSGKDCKDDYEEHVIDNYGRIKSLDDIIEEKRKRKKNR